jgi:hypothetical protein
MTPGGFAVPGATRPDIGSAVTRTARPFGLVLENGGV